MTIACSLATGGFIVPKFTEMDPTVTLADQSHDDGGPVIFVNILKAPAEDVDGLLAAWAAEAAAMKEQPGMISMQLHRGIAGSNTFLNTAVWETAAYFQAAAESPERKDGMSAYPNSVTVCPHLFRRVAMPGICVA